MSDWCFKCGQAAIAIGGLGCVCREMHDRAQRAEKERDEMRVELADLQLQYRGDRQEWRRRAECAEADAAALREALQWYADTNGGIPNDYGTRARDAIESSAGSALLEKHDGWKERAERVEKERDEWKTLAEELRVQESRISGALADASTVPTDSLIDGVLALVKERDEALAAHGLNCGVREDIYAREKRRAERAEAECRALREALEQIACKMAAETIA